MLSEVDPGTEALIDSVLKYIPKPKKILEEALGKLAARQLEADYVKHNFSEITVTLERTAYEIFLEYEKVALNRVIESWVDQNWNLIREIDFSNSLDATKRIARLFLPVAKRLEFRLGQMRKALAGRTFEMIVETLLKKIGCNVEKPKGEARERLERIDLVIPDQTTALERPDQAFFLACKRTLRERWKQAIPERRPGWRVFLLTLDDELAEDKAVEIDRKGVIAYVRDELKRQSHLANKPWIRRLSDLPRNLGLA